MIAMRASGNLSAILVVTFFAVVAVSVATAQPAHHSMPELATCSLYRSKKDGIPVYEKADTGSVIRGRLSLGEEVCYIGEQQGFAIIDWSKQPILRRYVIGGTKQPSEPEPEPEALPASTAGPETADGPGRIDRAHVRLVDLWEPRYPRYVPPGSWLKSIWDTLWSGGVPDDPYAPLRGAGDAVLEESTTCPQGSCKPSRP